MKTSTKIIIGISIVGLLSLIGYHLIQEVNEVFSDLDFNFDEPADDIQHNARI